MILVYSLNICLWKNRTLVALMFIFVYIAGVMVKEQHNTNKRFTGFMLIMVECDLKDFHSNA